MRIALLTIVAALVFAAAVPGAARADEPSCPTRPADPTADVDATVAELRALRQDLADSCAALAGSLATGSDRAHTDATAAADAAQRLQDRLDTLHTDLQLGADADHPLHTTAPVQPIELDDQARADLANATAQGSTLLHSDLWFALGLACSLFLMSRLYRLVMPRA